MSLAIVLGLGFGLPHIFGLTAPKAFGETLRRFPRNTGLGYALMLAATAWFLYNLQTEKISDFASYKKLMMIGFGAVGVGSCVYLKDFLAVRGLAVLLLLLAKLTLDTFRWAGDWRPLISAWAYVWILAGIWLTISPWRLRDFFDWLTRAETRLKTLCAVHLAFGLLVVLLGVTVFRSAS